MKQITKKVSTLVVDQWTGGKEEWIVGHLADLGFNVCFQQPRKGAREIDDSGAEIPAKGLMVAVAPWNWEICYVEPGEYVTLLFVDSDGNRIDVDLDRFDEVVAKVKAGTLNVELSAVKHRNLAREYDI